MAAPVATRILPKPGNYSGTGTAAHSHYSFDFDGPAYDLANVPNGTLIVFACSWGHEHSAAVVDKADANMLIRAGNVADYSGDPATLDEVTGPWSALSFAVAAPSSVIVIHYGLIYGILGDGTGGTIDKSQFDVTTGGASRITIEFTDDAAFYPLTDSWLTPVVTVYEPIAGFEARVDAALIDELSDAVATNSGIATLDLPGFTPPRSDNTSIVRAEAIADEFTAGDPSGWSESFTPVDGGSISGWNRGWHIRQDGSPSAIAASSIDVNDGVQPDGVAAILVRSIYWEAVGNTAPTDPTSVTGEAGNGEATCTWVDGTGSPSPTWDVEIAPGPSFTAWTSVAADLAQGTQTATATGLTNGTDYRFRVRGQNTEGDSAWVESATFTPTAITRDVKFQTGPVDVTTDGQTVTLPTPVGSLENAFVFIAGNRHQGAGPVGSSATQHADDMGVVAELTAVDTITFGYDGGNGTRVQWVVMEYVGAPGGANEFIVRGRHNFTFTSNANQTTALTNAPTNVNKVIPFIRGISSTHTSAGANNLGARAWMSNTGNTLNVACSQEDDTTTVGVTAVEFTGSNWSVGHMAWNGATSDGPIDRPLVQEADGDPGGTSFDVGDWATAAIMSWGHASDDANEAIADGWPLWEPTPASTTEVRWTFDANHDGADDDYVVHVLQHDDMAVTRYSDTSNAANANTIDITSAGLTDLARSLVLGTSITSGSGTAYGRGWCIYSLNSLTEAERWTHRSGNTMAHRIQVIDFAAVTSSTTPTPAGDVTGHYVDARHEAPALTVATVVTVAGHFVAAAHELPTGTSTPAATVAGHFVEARHEDPALIVVTALAPAATHVEARHGQPSGTATSAATVGGHFVAAAHELPTGTTSAAATPTATYVEARHGSPSGSSAATGSPAPTYVEARHGTPTATQAANATVSATFVTAVHGQPTASSGAAGTVTGHQVTAAHELPTATAAGSASPAATFVEARHELPAGTSSASATVSATFVAAAHGSPTATSATAATVSATFVEARHATPTGSAAAIGAVSATFVAAAHETPSASSGAAATPAPTFVEARHQLVTVDQAPAATVSATFVEARHGQPNGTAAATATISATFVEARHGTPSGIGAFVLIQAAASAIGRRQTATAAGRGTATTVTGRRNTTTTQRGPA